MTKEFGAFYSMLDVQLAPHGLENDIRKSRIEQGVSKIEFYSVLSVVDDLG